MPMKTALVLVLFAGFHVLHRTVAQSVDNDRYTKCARGMVADTDSAAVSGRSSLECFRRCSQTESCFGLNVCRDVAQGSRTVACSLLTGGFESTGCQNLTATSNAACYHAFKKSETSPLTTEATTTAEAEVTTTAVPLVCLNGGVANADGDECQCTIQYGGLTCGRYIRDCSEAYENGHQTPASLATLYIQPLNSPTPFGVLCLFETGGASTLALKRDRLTDMNKDWNTCKAGFQSDLYTNPSSSYFFVGLDDIHRLTQQADYRLDFKLSYRQSSLTWLDGTAVYHNWTIGPESSSYALTYDSFDTGASDIDNGYSSAQPVVFSAMGNCGCCRWGTAGWFGSDCKEYTVFFDGGFSWTTSGIGTTTYSVGSVEYHLVRTSDFYDKN